MGVCAEEARTSIRVSLGRFTEHEDVLSFAETVTELAAQLR